MASKLSRRSRIALVVVLGLATMYVAYRYTLHRMVEAKLDEIRKQGYPVTLAELDKWYPTPPPGENAADVYEKAFAQYEYVWTGERYASLTAGRIMVPPLFEKSVKLPAGSEELPEEVASAIRYIVRENREALLLLHKAATFKHCRYPIDLKLGADLLLPHLHKLRQGARLLQLEAIQHTDEGDPRNAVTALLSSIRLARSLENEPLLVSQLVRNSCIEITLQSFQRMVNRLQLSDESLTQLTSSLEALEIPTVMTREFVGELCLNNDLFQKTINKQLAILGPPPPPKEGGMESYAGFLCTRKELGKFRIRFKYLKVTGLMNRDHAVYLDLMFTTVEATKAPYPEILKKAEKVQHQVAALPPSRIISRYTLGSILSAFTKSIQNLSRIRTAEAAAAVERYRLTNNQPPEILEELVPTYLAAVPTDPFDGQPLRYKKLAKGYIVYSVGENGKDDGGDQTVSARTGWKTPDITFTVER